MKKFGELPVYFIIVGLLLNIIMYFYNPVSFINLMVRSSVVIISFAVVGYFLAYVLRDVHSALDNKSKNKEASENKREESTSTIDIRVSREDDDELLNMIPLSRDDEFIEVNPESFKTFMNQE